MAAEGLIRDWVQVLPPLALPPPPPPPPLRLGPTHRHGSRLPRASSPHSYGDLDRAESELVVYCGQLPADEGVDDCWLAYNFLEAQREQAQCDAESLERLNDVAHQLISRGDVSSPARTACCVMWTLNVACVCEGNGRWASVRVCAIEL